MKMYQKIRGLLAVAVAAMLLMGCGQNNDTDVNLIKPGQSDLEYVQSKGTLIVGVTDYAPMDFKTENGWTGFDAELAIKFAESLGVTLEFKEIDWDRKTELLADGIIDCIWNGMTMTEELLREMSCSEPYLSNAQVVVMQNKELDRYNTIEAGQHLLYAVEAGSPGETLLKERNYRYTTCDTQKDALQSVSLKKVDATVIDIIMAGYYTGEGNEFNDLGFAVSLNDEVICVGFRKDSDLTDKANQFLKTVYEDGTMQSMAEEYGIENAVLDQ